MSVTIAPERLKDATRMIYRRLARAHSTNLSETPVPSGETLARTLGYDPDGLPLPTAAWELFAGCGNPHEFVALHAKWRVLDLGCGVGIDSQIAAIRLRAPGLALGLDYTRELLDLARAYTAPHVRNRCIWLEGDGEDLPLRAASIHVAFANGSFVREEQTIGKTLRAAIDAGYEKAFTAIFDSNLTTFMTGVILFQFGTGPVQGFALTLMIGIAVSMFSAIFITRVIFNVLTDNSSSAVSFG